MPDREGEGRRCLFQTPRERSCYGRYLSVDGDALELVESFVKSFLYCVDAL